MNFDWTVPCTSQRSPIFADNIVATSQPLASQAGVEVLKAGGNAVDAALTAAITLSVVEPTNNGIGGDAYAIVWDGRTLHGINGSGRSPAAWSPQRFKGLASMPETGWDSVTVPGAVDVWVKLSERFGKLPFADLFASAIRHATDGYLVSPFVAAGWAKAAENLGSFTDFRNTFLPNGRPPQTGERFRSLDQARTLTKIAESHGDAFYRGELTEAIVAHASANGGALALEDLASHTSEWVDCIYLDYEGVRVHELPPNGQGVAALIALGILEHTIIDEYAIDSADSVHLQLEAMKIAFAETHGNVADRDSMRVSIDTLLNPEFLKQCAHGIDPQVACYPKARIKPDQGTVYLATADDNGMMVSFIQSNYHGFGSGVVIPGTGIALQNRGAGFALEKNHPNEVAGGKRPFHTIIPGFVSRDNQPLMSFGVMGGHMQPQGHLQVLLRMLKHKQNPQTALDAPRWHVDPLFSVGLETGFSKEIAPELARRGHSFMSEDEKLPGLFGGGQIICRLEGGGYCAGSDPRKDGQAVGF